MLELMMKKGKSNKNNEGASVVLVIFSIAFVGMLISMMVYASYHNFLMKNVDKEAKNVFYTAENAMDEICAGIELEFSTATAKAYTYALEQKTDVELDSRPYYFQEKFIKSFRSVYEKPLDNSRYDETILASYLQKTGVRPGESVGAVVTTSPDDAKIETDNDSIILKNVEVKYTDKKGYISIIKTDIRITPPDVNFALNGGYAEIENCAIIANKSLIVENNSNITIAGSVYAGEEALDVSNNSELTFKNKDGDSPSVVHRIIANQLRVANVYNPSIGNTPNYESVTVGKNYELWAQDIEVDTARIALRGSSFIKDDLSIWGKCSKVTLEGSYYGYGDQDSNSKASSAILINGAATTLDFSGLSNFMLSGHAYVGTTNYDANQDTDDYVKNLGELVESEDDPDVPYNSKDILMGESLAVKANQLMYLVPKECMWYTNQGVQYIDKNPISYEEYIDLMNQYVIAKDENGAYRLNADGTYIYELDSDGNRIPSYTPVNLDVICNKVNKSINSMGASYETVFRKINGSVLVYFYLKFDAPALANQFFVDYYTSNPEVVEEYVRSYVKDFKWNSAIGQDNNFLNLAGNQFYFDNNDVFKINKQSVMDDVDEFNSLESSRSVWNDTFVGLSKKFVSSTVELTSEQLQNNMYQNLIVEDTIFDSIVPDRTEVTFEGGSGIKAKVYNNKNTPRTLQAADVDGVSFIIATGDVVLNANFTGLIITKGTLQLTTDCNIIEYDPASVRAAMAAQKDDIQLLKLFVDGEAYARSAGTVPTGDMTEKEEREANRLRTSSYINYQNWTKK